MMTKGNISGMCVLFIHWMLPILYFEKSMFGESTLTQNENNEDQVLNVCRKLKMILY